MKFAAFAFSIILFLSCKKNDAPVPTPVPEEYSVITTGILYNSAAKTYEGYYWEDEERQLLPSGGSAQAFPYGLDKKGNEIYIAGSYAGKHPASGSDVLMPCYWANGVKKELPVDALEFSERCSAGDVKWFNDAWYVLGDYDLKPVIWKIKGSAIESIKLPALDGAAEELRKTSNLEVHAGQLYIGGNRKKIKNNKVVFDAGYWTINAAGQIGYQVLEDNLSYALSFFIKPTVLGVYMSGEYSNQPGNSKAAIWSPAGRILYIDALNPSYNRVRSIAMNDDKKLFAVVHNIQSYTPLLNKIQPDGSHELIAPEIPAGARGLCETLAVLNNQVAYTYIYESAGKKYAEIIVNNQKQELDIDNNAWADFHRTVIFKK